MVKRHVLSFLVIVGGLWFSPEVKAQVCFYNCTPSPQIIGYQPYSYIAPQITYSTQIGYHPIYGYPGIGMGGGWGYPGTPGINGGFPGMPSYGGGFPGMYPGVSGGYNPNWLGMGFPFSYPRGMVNLAPRSGRPGSGYTSRHSTRSPSRGAGEILERPPTISRPAPQPDPTLPTVVVPESDPVVAVDLTVEQVTSCDEYTQLRRRRTTTRGDADGQRCAEYVRRVQSQGDVVVLDFSIAPESSICVLKVIKKENLQKCLPGPPSSVPGPFEEVPAVDVPVTDSPTPVTTIPAPSNSSCPAGEAKDPTARDKMGTQPCVPCAGNGYTETRSGYCECAQGYGTDIENGFKCIPPDTNTEGDTCKGDCESPTPPVADTTVPTDPLKCEYKVGERVLKFDCVCAPPKKVYPISGLSPQTNSKQFDATFEQALNNDANLALCLFENMKSPLGTNSRLNCTKPNEAGKRGGAPYCFRPEYYSDVFKAFKEAAVCFGLNEKDQGSMFSMMSRESRFQLDAVNPTDPSVGIGQIHYQKGRTGEELKISNRYDKYLVNEACKERFKEHTTALSSFGNINSSNNHLCSATVSPEQSMFLAMAVYKGKQAAVDHLLSSQTCHGNGKKASEAFTAVDESLKARLTSLAYNMGEGNLTGVVCSYLQAKDSNTYTHKTSARGRARWTLRFNKENITSGGTDLPENTSVKPTTGFWGLVQTYYNTVPRHKGHLNYVFAMSESSKATSAAAGVQCPRP